MFDILFNLCLLNLNTNKVQLYNNLHFTPTLTYINTPYHLPYMTSVPRHPNLLEYISHFRCLSRPTVFPKMYNVRLKKLVPLFSPETTNG